MRKVCWWRAVAGSGLFLVGCASSAPIAPPPPIEVPPVEVAGDDPSSPAPDARLTVATTAPRAVQRPAAPQCDVDLATRIGPKCHVMFPTKVTATSASDSAAAALDGSICSTWNAGGFAPASLTVDLGEAADI